MFSTPNTAPVGSPRELLKGGNAWKARYRYDEPSTRTRSGREFMRAYNGGGGVAPFSFFDSGAETSGAGAGAAGCESGVCGEFGASVLSEAGGVSAGRVTTSPAGSGR